MAISFFCQKCGEKLEAEDAWAGQESECPSCSTVLVVPGPQVTPVATAEDMPVLFRCPVCGTLRGYDRARMGKDVECTDCGAISSLHEPKTFQCLSCHHPVDEADTRCASCGATIPPRVEREQAEERKAQAEAAARQIEELRCIQGNAVAALGNEIRCPRCGSTQFAAGKKGFNGVAGLLGALAVGPIGLIAGCAGSNAIEITCLSCTHTWKPSALGYWVRKIASARK